MLEADDGNEPDGSLPPPAEGWGSHSEAGRASGEVDRSSGEQGDLMFATAGRICSVLSSESAGRGERSSRGANSPTVGWAGRLRVGSGWGPVDVCVCGGDAPVGGYY